MLLGETEHTLQVRLIVSALVLWLRQTTVGACLDSGLKGIIQAPYLTDDQTGQIHVDNYVKKRGQTIAAVIVAVGLNLAHDSVSSPLNLLMCKRQQSVPPSEI
jgi:hypothetical protein